MDFELDRKSLEKELANALVADEVYHKTDEMKKRAITSARSYDEFKNMVACANLTPLKSKEIDFVKVKRASNKSFADDTKVTRSLMEGDEPVVSSEAIVVSKEASITVPLTAHDFAKHWRRLCKTSEQRYAYIRLIPAPSISHIFVSDIDFSILGEITTAFACHRATCADSSLADTTEELQILRSLTKVPRFSLSAKFLDKKEKDSLAKYFEAVKEQLARLDAAGEVSSLLEVVRTGFLV